MANGHIPVEAKKLIQRQLEIERRIALIEARLGLIETRANPKKDTQ